MTSKVPDTSTPDGILRLGGAFREAKALLTAFELGLFTVLHHEPATEEQIRQRLGLHGRGLSDFLNLLVALGLLARTGGGYCNAAGADRYLVPGEGTYVSNFLAQVNRNHYPAWGRLAEALRTGEPQADIGFTTMLNTPALLAPFVDRMEALTNVQVPLLIESFGWPGSGTVLDVGGARGNLVAQVVRAQPQLTGTVFDLPQMAPLFDELISQYGLGTVHFHGGDFFTDELPQADVVIMGNVLHDWNPEQRRMLVEKAFHAVSSGGALLVYDQMLNDDPDHQVEKLIRSLHMLLITEGGSEYPVSELRINALAAGFTSVTDQPLGDYDTLMICRKGT